MFETHPFPFTLFLFTQLIIRLLLRELYQRTDPEHPDYSKLKEAISAVQKQADMVNTKIKKSQASNEVISIQEKLVGDNVPVSIFNFLEWNQT